MQKSTLTVVISSFEKGGTPVAGGLKLQQNVPFVIEYFEEENRGTEAGAGMGRKWICSLMK